MPDDIAARLMGLEHARCAAVSNSDAAAVGRLNGDDLTYTHNTGMTEDLKAHLASLSAYERRLSRADDLAVRVYGDVAVMTGTVHAGYPTAGPGGTPVEFDAHALQVWVKEGQSWKQVAFASSGQLPDALRR
ncbi:MAG TPA: nuclear transport factor 2 family protein [Solirubrobacteraceae bacterium]|jgi:ketosteroid isomerase-like protein|nr:nuclear transport factor 2 family protein [Solirubrobacteraceae bacterium]